MLDAFTQRFFAEGARVAVFLMALMAWRVDAVENRFIVTPASEDRYHIRIDLNDPEKSRDITAEEIPRVKRVDREAQGRSPAFVRVIELTAGRSVVVESLNWTSEVIAGCEALDRFDADDDILSVTLGRMGRRVFVRIEARPFQPEPTRGQWSFYPTIEAVLRVSGECMETPEDIRPRTVLKDFGCRPCPPPVPLGVSAGMNGLPVDFAPRRSVTNSLAWKIEVSQPGLYRVTQSDLTAAGMPVAFQDASRLQISCRDRVVPLWRSTDGAMGESDWIAFYGVPVSGTAISRNVYWLSIGDSSPEPAVASAEPVMDSHPATSAWHTVEYAPKVFFRATHNPLDDSYDHWFAMEVAGGTQSNIAFKTLYPVQTGEVHLAYSIHGADSQPELDCRSIVRLEGIKVLDATYGVRTKISGSVKAPGSALRDGWSEVSVEQDVLPGVPPERAGAYIEWLRLCYQRLLKAESLPFFFNGSSESSDILIRRIPTHDVWLLDVSDPLAPRQVEDYVLTPDGEGWALRFRNAGGDVKAYGLFDASSFRPVETLRLKRFRNLSDATRQADYLVVTPEVFRRPVYRLLKHRYRNNLSVQVATIEDVYNEFSYGIEDPVAIRQYFGYAYHHYERDEPRYALLVGNGTYDPADHLGAGAPEHIPVRMGPAPWRRTAHEQWFVTVDGSDLLPDLRLGRIPAGTVAEVEHAVDKIIAFDTAPDDAPWRMNALLVADQADAHHDFKAFVEADTRARLINAGFDPLFGIQTAYRDDMSQVMVRQTIQGALDDGIHLINYMGHGGVRQWSSPSVWNVDNTLTAGNTVFPIVTVFTCQNGLFFEPLETSLAQAMIVNAGGASAMVAPTALAVQIFSEPLAKGFYEALTDGPARAERLGDALQEGFVELWSFNPNVAELRFYSIFGDPAQSIWGGARP